tara:strand:- start:331 stop:1062 length:732 start_codon:yes stop_codon:yes gene_type:complete
MSDHQFFEHLFKHAKQVTPYLDGKLASLPDNLTSEHLIHIDHTCSEQIRQLYACLEKSHPEAGSAYWLTRTWTLLCWQPIYVAFISVYACQGIPDLRSIAQKIQPSFVSGFQFVDTTHQHGTIDELIELAGEDLTELFDYYRQEMNLWTRIRPGFTKHLIADGILGCIVKLSQFAPHLSHEYLKHQASQWLEACNLPTKLVNTLHLDEATSSLKLVRTSCCLVYKCDGRELCNDCPRHPDNKR